jgi:hypothetical protein
MHFFRHSPRAACAFAAAAILAACAQHGAMLPATSSPQGIAARALILPDRHPPKCTGQQNTQQYASLTETLSTKGGKVCIPEFGGFGGSVTYPPANPSVSLGLISSTTNYDNMPELGNGTAMFYLQLAISGKTGFGSKAQAGGGLTSKKIVAGKPYTAYGQAVFYGIKFNFGPCYATATKGKYGGVIGGIGSLLEGVSVPGKASGVIEVYPGQQTSTQC